MVSEKLLHDLPLVVEEKLDGSNCGVSFNDAGELVLQSRGHALTGGPRERQFDLFKRWANYHLATLHNLLGNRYVMYGEWLYARHSIAYDQLPHYFLEFDVLDRVKETFLTTQMRIRLFEGSPVVSAPVLAAGKVSNLERLVGRSTCSTSETMEGLYIKQESQQGVISRHKFVREGFLQRVADSGEHWMDRPIEPNLLRHGADIFR